MRRTIAALIVLVGLLAAPSTPAANAQQPLDVAIQGSLPELGGMALIAVRAQATTTMPRVIEVLREDGCDPTLLARTTGGAFQMYTPGAPPFVNAQFPAELQDRTLMIVRCAVPASDLPDAHLLELVTKEHALPSDFVPEALTTLAPELVMPGGGSARLTEETAEALERMLEAASRSGHDIRVRSAYRSYQEQVQTYQYWVSALGEEEADRRSARPGHSEHQLGTVVDVTSASVGWDLAQEFGDTPEGRWLSQNAWRYGFVESYPEGAEAITGYRYEPWHLRYVGETHADWLRHTDLTLTQYLTRIHGE